MKHRVKKLLAGCMALVMTLSLLPGSVLAGGLERAEGDDRTAVLSESGEDGETEPVPPAQPPESYDVQVPGELRGVQAPENGQYRITADAALPGGRLWVSFYDGQGGHATRSMSFGGETENGRFRYELTVSLDPEHNSFEDSVYGTYFYADTCAIRVFATDASPETPEHESYTGRVVGQPVERDLFFGPLSRIVLTDFAAGDEMVIRERDFTLRGYAAPASSVSVREGDTLLATAQAGADGSFALQLTGLTEGSHSLTVGDSSGQTQSRTVTLTADRTAPQVTGLRLAFGEEGSALLTWSCGDRDLKQLRIYREEELLGQVPAGTVSYPVQARPGDGVRFTVEAEDQAGNCASVSMYNLDREKPTPPTGLTAAGIGPDWVKLTWTAGTDNVGPAGYNIYLDGVLTRELRDGQTELLLSGLKQSHTYEITVRTVDQAGNLSEPGAVLSVKTAGLALSLQLPESLILDEYPDREIPVSGEVTSDVPGYHSVLSEARLKYRAAGRTGWTEAPLSVRENRVSGVWTVSGAEDGFLPAGSYELQLTAQERTGAQVASPIVTVELKRDDRAPTAPGAAVADGRSTTSLAFHWEAAQDNVAVDHYQVWRDGVRLKARVTGTSFTDRGLEQGRTYVYTIRAVDGRGNVSEASPETAMTTAALNFERVIALEPSYVEETQPGRAVPVWAWIVPPEEGVSSVTVRLEFKAGSGKVWTSVPMQADASAPGRFTGAWDLSGNVLGFLPLGSYRLRFAVTDGAVTTYSREQTVELKGDEVKPVITGLTPDSGVMSGRDLVLTASASDNRGVKELSLDYAPADSERFTTIGRTEGRSLRLTWNAADLPSGRYQLRARAVDERGNTAEKIVVILLDNTAPAAPGQLTAVGTSRYIRVMWDQNYSKSPDFDHFNVYRSTSAGKGFALVKELHTIGYYDDERTVKAGTTYYYYVTAVDRYGNESQRGPVVSAAMVGDMESPVILSMTPAEGDRLRRSAELTVTASDNYRLSRAVFEYRVPGGQWTMIGQAEAGRTQKNGTFTVEWKLPEGLTGPCSLRVRVYDHSADDVEPDSGYAPNAPAEQIVSVELLPYSRPAIPVVSVSPGYRQAQLSWTYSGAQETLDRFEICTSDAQGSEGVRVATVEKGVSGACTVTVAEAGAQYFLVKAVDIYGETASAVVTVTSLQVDWSGVEQALAQAGYVYGEPVGKAVLPARGTASAQQTTVSGAFSFRNGKELLDAGPGVVTVIFTVDGASGEHAGLEIPHNFEVSIAPKPLTEEMLTVTGEYTYTGSPIMPSYTVSDGRLMNKSDYKVRATGNVNAGTAKLTVIGQGNYTGMIDRSFSIAPARVSGRLAVISGPVAVGLDLTVSAEQGSGYAWQWYRNGEPVRGSVGMTYTITEEDQGCTLTVRGTARGNYTGEIDSNTVAVPAGAPARPVLKAEAGDGRVVLSWEAPRDNGAPITSYKLWMNNFPLATLSPGQTSFQVENLTNGTEYTFILRVFNSAGVATSGTVRVVPESGSRFTDVTEEDYFYQPVQWAVEHRVTAGISPTEFGPDLNCTRAQIVTFLWNAEGQPKPAADVNPFTDVKKSDWYYEAVLWAVEQDITAGISATEFGPDLDCTRAQAMTFLWKHQGRPAADFDMTFTDVREEDWFFQPVRWAVANGITSGVGGNRFGSEENCLRAQIVTFLYRVLTK